MIAIKTALPAPADHQLSELSALMVHVVILLTQTRLAAQREQLDSNLSQLNQRSSNMGQDTLDPIYCQNLRRQCNSTRETSRKLPKRDGWNFKMVG